MGISKDIIALCTCHPHFPMEAGLKYCSEKLPFTFAMPIMQADYNPDFQRVHPAVRALIIWNLCPKYQSLSKMKVRKYRGDCISLTELYVVKALDARSFRGTRTRIDLASVNDHRQRMNQQLPSILVMVELKRIVHFFEF